MKSVGQGELCIDAQDHTTSICFCPQMLHAKEEAKVISRGLEQKK